MAINKLKVADQINYLLKQNLQNPEIKVEGTNINYAVPMQLVQNGDPGKVYFSARVNDNFVETFCIMTMDFFDLQPEQEVPADFYKLMNAINVSTKGTCSYFYTENALICSAITPMPVKFDPDVFLFKTYNMMETVGRFTASFYGLLNGHVTFEELLKIYSGEQQ